MSNFCHPENPGSSHWLGCACSESAWAEKLAAAQAELAIARAVARPLFSRRMLEEKLVAAEERARRLEEAARDMVREWRLHGQLTDSCRPMERVLGIHAPFCPTWGHKDCECDLSITPPPEAEKRGEG